jgi:5-methylcytosine-specific restriction protein A
MDNEEIGQDTWTDEELDAVVDVYLVMLRSELSGSDYSKKDKITRVMQGVLSGRTEKAVEWRMQNISSVLNDLGAPWVDGYKPASHVGPAVETRIRAALIRCLLKDWSQTDSSKTP